MVSIEHILKPYAGTVLAVVILKTRIIHSCIVESAGVYFKYQSELVVTTVHRFAMQCDFSSIDCSSLFVIVGNELYGRTVRENIYRSVFDSCTHGEGGDDFFSVYQTVSTDEYYFVLRTLLLLLLHVLFLRIDCEML